MEAPQPKREWYKKKRFLIPAGLLGLLFVFGDSGPVEPAIIQSDRIDNEPVLSNEETTRIFDKPLETEPVKIERSCHPSYSGCLKPDAGDYDCASGSGNGPNYTGPVRVLGYDEFGLDRDGDGWGCE